MKPSTIGSLGQWLGLAALILAIAIMLARREPAGAVAATVASLLYALSTKIKYYAARRRRRPRTSVEELAGYNRRSLAPLAPRAKFT